MEGARTKGQDHLLAISRRPVLVEALTDVLVERGDQRVAQSTAENPGARFSEFGYSTLVKRSEDDPELALRMLSRREIPRQHMLKLFADASEAVPSQSSRRPIIAKRRCCARWSRRLPIKSRRKPGTFRGLRGGPRLREVPARVGKLTKGQLETLRRRASSTRPSSRCRSCATCRSAWWSAQ